MTGTGSPRAGRARRCLIVTEDVLTERMAGPAIRAWQAAEALAGAGLDVIVATSSSLCRRSSPHFGVEAAGPERFAALEQWCDVMIVQGWVLFRLPVLARTQKPMVVDLYDPLHLETLQNNAHESEPDRSINVASSIRVLSQQILRGDFFICASEKQRDLWMGFLSAAGRVNPAVCEQDPTLRRLIDVVAFGLPGQPPVHERPALKGVHPGIAAGDEVALWGGGVYDWFDPLTAIRAIDVVRRTRPRVRLFFLGVRHPNAANAEPAMLGAARSLADELGLAGRHVFFNEAWVAYEDRHNYLLEADVGLSLHLDHVEATYAFRTRILDYLWASLPIVATSGDTFAELIQSRALGRVVRPGGVEEAASAIADLLQDGQECRRRAGEVAPSFAWSRVLAPLVAFCSDPRRAPDRDSLIPYPRMVEAPDPAGAAPPAAPARPPAAAPPRTPRRFFQAKGRRPN